MNGEAAGAGILVAIGSACLAIGARMQSVDLELIAQRVLKLAEIATLEHLEMLMQSQAKTILAIQAEEE